MENELTDIELAQLIRIYSEFTAEEKDPAIKKLWWKTLMLYIEEAKEKWFAVD